MKTTIITGERPTLEEVQKLVGGYIEFVYSDGDIQIICNEEGKLRELPINEEATNYWFNLMTPSTFTNDFLVGDVVILKGKAQFL